MTIQTVALNGTNIEDLGLSFVGMTGWHSITQRSYGKVALPLRRGQRVLSTSHTVAAREFGFQWIITPTDGDWTDRQTKIDSLAAQFTGLVTVTLADAPTRGCYGLLDTLDVNSIGGAYILSGIKVDAKVVCDDPLFYDLTPVVTGITAGIRGAISMGTGPVRRMVVTVNGPVTNPVVILRDQTGTEAQRMTLTGTLGASTWLAIDCDAYTITKSDGTNLLQAGWLGVGEAFFELRQPYTYTLACDTADLSVSHYRSYEA